MMHLFSDEMRRNPYPMYRQMRGSSPVYAVPQSNLWMLFDYEGVKRALTDHETFSSRIGPAEWMVFMDPPRHSKLRALISQAFTPRSVANLEPRIRELSRELLDKVIAKDEMDLMQDFAVPLPMRVIVEMLGAPVADHARFQRWNDVLLNMSYTIPGGEAAARFHNEFVKATAEMNEYVADLLAARHTAPRDDLLTRLLEAQVDRERLAQHEIVGFFQLLLLAGSETTTNLIGNAILSFLENPDQLGQVRAAPGLLPSAIEEVLRYRSPLQWMIRLTKREADFHGQVIPAGKVVLVMMGSANHDPGQFSDPDRFDVTRNPNPHVAFGHGMHFCLGAPLARLESRVALTEFLGRFKNFERATREPWEPRPGLHVHGPTRLPIRLETAERAG